MNERIRVKAGWLEAEGVLRTPPGVMRNVPKTSPLSGDTAAVFNRRFYWKGRAR
jgi:hypothetical protein